MTGVDVGRAEGSIPTRTVVELGGWARRLRGAGGRRCR